MNSCSNWKKNSSGYLNKMDKLSAGCFNEMDKLFTGCVNASKVENHSMHLK